MRNPKSNYSRYLLLGLAAASIIGWGCAVPVKIATEKDYTARSTYQPAAEKGDPVAQLQLALAYRFGTAGAPKNSELALQWLNKSADNKLLEAQLMLGDTLVSGNWGNPKNIDVGLGLLRSVAENGARDIQEHLAITLLELNENKYTTESVIWFDKAARADNKHAARQLAKLYESGTGVSQDYANAYAWFAIAGAALDLIRLERILSKSQLSRAQYRASALQKEIGR